MKYQYLFDTFSGQDGAICNGYLFRFNHKGYCQVYDMEARTLISSFELDRCSELAPHSNAVCFGTQYFCEGDEFPLLYTNIYNNYSKEENRLEGICCVYRLTRCEHAFSTKLVQLIRIGFVDDLELWKSLANNGDVRPYGNFVIDTDKNQYWAFTMRDKEKTTRYFSFSMPDVNDGEMDKKYGVKTVILKKQDILKMFDCGYSRFLQGACYYDGKIFSVEGFSKNGENLPKLQIIDLNTENAQEFDICSMGLEIEPEFIESYQDNIYYSAADGKVYLFTF